MTHILFISSKDAIPPTLREALSAPEIRIVTRQTPEDARSALERNAFNLSIIYEEGSVSNLRRHLQSIRELNSQLPILVISQDYSLEAEQLTFDEGGELYFAEPLPRRSLERIIQQQAGLEPEHNSSQGYSAPPAYQEAPASMPVPALQILRDFSHILRFSLDYKAFTHHFVLKLRDYVSFSRIGIFLETEDSQTISTKRPSRTLACIASFGLPSDLIDCFQLSRDLGIGRALAEQPRIIHASGANQNSTTANTGIAKEFAILGCHIAIPINDRERCIGAAVINGPVTGRNYSEDELQLLYLLMEELGLAIRNSRLHAGLAAHGRLISSVLESMSSGALVLSETLEVLYTNESASRFLREDPNSNHKIEWADLPAALASPIHRAVEKGELSEPFIIPGWQKDTLFRISIIPFSMSEELPLLPRPVMVVIEDFTHIEASKQSAMEDTRTELISLIAERFAHEIRNSLVPLTTHMQLIDRKIEQPKFQTSLKAALKKETGRIKRFSDQMLYLAQNSNPISEPIDLRECIEEAFSKAKVLANCKTAKLEVDDQSGGAKLEGNTEAIAYAFEELFLNSFQAQENALKKSFVTLQKNDEGILSVKLSDAGPGFEEAAITSATEPFFTTRNTGVGLGLSVANKIINEHQGFITIANRSEYADWDIKIELPLTSEI